LNERNSVSTVKGRCKKVRTAFDELAESVSENGPKDFDASNGGHNPLRSMIEEVISQFEAPDSVNYQETKYRREGAAWI
jgi:hypothetical protein